MQERTPGRHARLTLVIAAAIVAAAPGVGRAALIYDVTLRRPSAPDNIPEARITSRPLTDIIHGPVSTDHANCFVEEGCLAGGFYSAVKRLPNGSVVNVGQNMPATLNYAFPISEVRRSIFNMEGTGRLTIVVSGDLGRNRLHPQPGDDACVVRHEPVERAEYLTVKGGEDTNPLVMLEEFLFQDTKNNCDPTRNPDPASSENVDANGNVLDPDCGFNIHTDATRTGKITISAARMKQLVRGGDAEPGAITIEITPENGVGRLKIFSVKLEYGELSTVAVASLLSGFTGRGIVGSVELEFSLADESGLAGVHVYRLDEGAVEDRRLTGSPLGLDGRDMYHFTDVAVRPGGTYRYALGLVLAEGGETRSDLVSVRVPFGEFGLGRPRPNPGATGFALNVGMPKEGRARLRVFDIVGREVASVFDGRLPAGDHAFTWSGSQRDGRAVSSGAYYVVFESAGRRAVEHLVVVK